MALALVRSLEQSGDRIVLDVDTGTNPLYRVRLGREVHDDDGVATLDDVFWQSPWARNEHAGRHLDTRVRVAVPTTVTEPRCLVQVVTAKDGPRAAAYSRPERVVTVSPGLTSDLSVRNGSLPALAVPTMVGVRSARDTFSRPASLDDLIGSLVQAALPLVQQLLSGAAPAGGTTAAPATPGTAGAPAGGDQLAATIAAVLQAALGAVGGTTLAVPHSVGPNRFRDAVSAPMIFGIDDALIASLAGPILSSIAGPLLEHLPALLNAASQHRLDSRNADYQMINQLIAGAERSRLADRIAFLGAPAPTAPADAGAAAGAPDLAALLELLRSATAAGAASAPPSPADGATRPLSLGAAATATPSRIQLAPVTGEPVAWMGRPRVVLVRDRAVALRWRLETGGTGPATALPRAILRVVVRRAGGGPDLLDREERLTDLAPGAEVGIQLDPAALLPLPAETELEVFAQLRWPTAAGNRQCTSTHTVVLTAGAYVVGAGAPAGDRVELTDMTRFRPFWNKVWSSPAPTADLPLWGIDATLRYSVVLTEAPANALMEVRALSGVPTGGLRATTNGRMRSGLEVSVHELAKLRALWPDAAPLDDATVAAFAAPEWLAGQGGDAEVPIRFDGRRSTRGLVWVVPVPALRSFTLARPKDVDPRGQVLSVSTTEVTFPVVEAVRVLGLASTDSAGDPAEDPADDTDPTTGGSAYGFEGYQVVRDTLVGLEPTRPLPTEGTR